MNRAPTRPRRPLTTDDYLRANGFRIWGRPAGKLPYWERAGIVMRQDRAIAVIRRENKYEEGDCFESVN